MWPPCFQLARELCPHHLGHYLGMDVHDTDSVSRNERLQPGMVVTVEPGKPIPHNNYFCDLAIFCGEKSSDNGLFRLHGNGPVGPNILYGNVHTGPRQDRNWDPLFPVVLVPFPVPVTFSCRVNKPLARPFAPASVVD